MNLASRSFDEETSEDQEHEDKYTMVLEEKANIIH